MEKLRIQFPVETVIDDERSGNVEALPAGSVKELEYDIAITLLLQADPAPRLLSPIKLRSGFVVHWQSLSGDPAEGLLLMECAFQRDTGLEEWLLVQQGSHSQLIARSRLVGWDPGPMIEAIRTVYRISSSDRVPMLAESCLRAIIETPDEGPHYGQGGRHYGA